MDRHSRLEMMRILVSGQWQGLSPHGNGWHSEGGLRGMVGLDERGDCNGGDSLWREVDQGVGFSGKNDVGTSSSGS